MPKIFKRLIEILANSGIKKTKAFDEISVYVRGKKVYANGVWLVPENLRNEILLQVTNNSCFNDFSHCPLSPNLDKQEDLTARLPFSIRQLKDRYPVSISELSKFFMLPPLPKGFIPNEIEVFFGEKTSRPGIWFSRGELKAYDLSNPSENDVIRVYFDKQLVYLQIECISVLDRIGGALLPSFFRDIHNQLHILLI
jgi:hypothetical protein